MIGSAKLASGIFVIMRGHLAPFSSEIPDAALKTIAAELAARILRGERGMALDQYVGTELNKLGAAPNYREEIVAGSISLIENSN